MDRTDHNENKGILIWYHVFSENLEIAIASA